MQICDEMYAEELRGCASSYNDEDISTCRREVQAVIDKCVDERSKFKTCAFGDPKCSSED
ncbi:hypothetical protein EB231_32260 [Mesorhizobium sp. NZP2298]|nr:hypothetical protein EB231_32260 [Mesorhizobium sp. NZP2298]